MDPADHAQARWFISLFLSVLGGHGLRAMLEAACAAWSGDFDAAGGHLTKAVVFLPFGAWGYLRWSRDARGERPPPPEIGGAS